MANTLKFGNGQWAVKESSALAYNDENGNFKPLPFTFVRDTGATRVNKQGLIEVVSNNEPRIDFLNDSKGALLLEPSRSNLFTYSEDIPQVFAETSLTDTFEYGIAPNGIQKSTRLQLTTLGTSRYAETITSFVTSGTTYTFSCYYKGIEGETAYIKVLVVGGTSVDKQIVFTGEWQREQVTFTAGSSTNLAYIVDTREGGNATDFEVWGAQLEQGSYATSYIPTQGSIGTRTLETSNIYNLDDYVSSKTSWTAMGEFVKGQDKGNSLYIFYAYYLASSNLFRIRDYIDSVRFYLFEPIEQSYGFSATLGQTIKWAIRAKSDGTYSVYINGALFVETSGTFRKLDSYRMFGNAKTSVNNLRVYNTALTDSELQALTQI